MMHGMRLVALAFLALGFCAAETEWTRIGPVGGSSFALAADPRTPGTLYAAASTGEIFRTADGGTNWTPLSSPPPTPGIGFLAIDSAGTLYVAGFGSPSKTTDGGETWTAIDGGLPAACRGNLAIDPLNAGTLYMASFGVCKSIDGGMTWTEVNSGADLGTSIHGFTVEVLAVDPQNPQTIYAHTGYGFFTSTDGGATWNAVSSGLPLPTPVFNNGYLSTPPGTAGMPAIALDPRHSGTVYVGSLGHVYKTIDGGASWNDASTGLPQVPAGYPGVLFLAVNPNSPATVYALIRQNYPYFTPPILLCISTDGGESWTTATDPALSEINIPLAPDADRFGVLTPDPHDAGTVYLAASYTVLKTTDGGGHWLFVNTGFRAVGVSQVAVDSNNGALLVNSSEGWEKSTDGGATWFGAATVPGGVNSLALCCLPQAPQTLYVLVPQTGSTELFVSADFGDSWSNMGSIPARGYASVSLTIDPQDSKTSVCVVGFVVGCTVPFQIRGWRFHVVGIAAGGELGKPGRLGSRHRPERPEDALCQRVDGCRH